MTGRGPTRSQRGVLNAMSVSHPIPGPLAAARFVQRYNRFLLQVRLEVTGELAAVHMADPGRLRELLLPGTKSRFPAHKIRWLLFFDF